MAASNGEAGPGHNSAMDRDAFYGLRLRYVEAESELASARRACKEPAASLAKIKKEIGNLGEGEAKAFYRALEDDKLPASVREAEARTHALCMTFLRKPMNYQAEMFEDVAPPEYSETELQGIEFDGVEAGKAGSRQDRNPHNVGDEAYQRWDAGWMAGQAELAETLKDGSPPKKARGRPAGSKNKKGTKAAGKKKRAAAAEPEPPAYGEETTEQPAGEQLH